jgi:hypothetical protein
MDSRTCEICLNELNGIMLPADDPRWLGPLGKEAHDGCRFDLVPVFGGIDPVMDMTPDELVPQLVEHLRSLMPLEQAQLMMNELFAASGVEIIRTNVLTWEDLEDIFVNEELLYRIFELGG